MIYSPLKGLFATAGLYFWHCVCSMHLAYKNPLFSLSYSKYKEILTYTFYIILSGSVANLLLDGDKIMLNQYMVIDNIAFLFDSNIHRIGNISS
jgi:O-antigen/teichoic acid export membrane protein